MNTIISPRSASTGQPSSAAHLPKQPVSPTGHLLCQLLLGFLGVFLACTPVHAEERSTDAVLKQQLLGYWKSPRHGYLYKSDGVVYMCPRKMCTTKNQWDVKNGVYSEKGASGKVDSYQIISLTKDKFVYRGMDARPMTFTLTRTTEKEAEAE